MTGGRRTSRVALSWAIGVLVSAETGVAARPQANSSGCYRPWSTHHTAAYTVTAIGR